MSVVDAWHIAMALK